MTTRIALDVDASVGVGVGVGVDVVVGVDGDGDGDDQRHSLVSMATTRAKSSVARRCCSS